MRGTYFFLPASGAPASAADWNFALSEVTQSEAKLVIW